MDIPILGLSDDPPHASKTLLMRVPRRAILSALRESDSSGRLLTMISINLWDFTASLMGNLSLFLESFIELYRHSKRKPS